MTEGVHLCTVVNMNAETPKPVVVLSDRRLAVGLTQVDVAAKLGVSHVTVGRWESGESKPQPRYYPRLAEVLNIPAEEVVRLFAPEAATPTPA